MTYASNGLRGVDKDEEAFVGIENEGTTSCGHRMTRSVQGNSTVSPLRRDVFTTEYFADHSKPVVLRSNFLGRHFGLPNLILHCTSDDTAA